MRECTIVGDGAWDGRTREESSDSRRIYKVCGKRTGKSREGRTEEDLFTEVKCSMSHRENRQRTEEVYTREISDEEEMIPDDRECLSTGRMFGRIKTTTLGEEEMFREGVCARVYTSRKDAGAWRRRHFHFRSQGYSRRPGIVWPAVEETGRSLPRFSYTFTSPQEEVAGVTENTWNKLRIAQDLSPSSRRKARKKECTRERSRRAWRKDKRVFRCKFHCRKHVEDVNEA